VTEPATIRLCRIRILRIKSNLNTGCRFVAQSQLVDVMSKLAYKMRIMVKECKTILSNSFLKSKLVARSIFGKQMQLENLAG